MAKAAPTEEELGIEPTPEEIEVLSRPAQTIIDDPEDDIPLSEEDDIHQIAKPKAEGDDKPKRVKDPETGKFVSKAKDGEEGDKPDAVVTPPPKGFVDQRALQEARAENKLLMERMTTLLEIQQKRDAPKVEERQIPDRATDPLAYMEYMDERLGKFEAETAQQKQAREADEREQAEVYQALSTARPQFEEAAAADPNIPLQYNALLESYAKEIVYLNRNNPDFQRDQRGFLSREMTKLENGHIKFAVSQGQNVAEYMRGLAESRGIGIPQAQPGQAPTATPAPAKTIPQRQAAQDRHLSIGDLPGSAVPSQISAKDLVKMSPKQFAEFAKKMGDAGMDEMFGKA